MGTRDATVSCLDYPSLKRVFIVLPMFEKYGDFDLLNVARSEPSSFSENAAFKPFGYFFPAPSSQKVRLPVKDEEHRENTGEDRDGQDEILQNYRHSGEGRLGTEVWRLAIKEVDRFMTGLSQLEYDRLSGLLVPR